MAAEPTAAATPPVAPAPFGMRVRILAPDGTATEGIADITLISQGRRNLLAAIYGVGGFALGAVSILIPILHLCTVWFLPLLGLVMAARACRRTFNVRSLAGTCPACNAALQMGGREMPDSEWQTCPSCNARLRLQPQATPQATPQSSPRQ